MSQLRVPRVVRPSRGPIREAEEHRVVKPPQPPPEAPPKPAVNALTLIALWRRFRLAGDAPNAARTIRELERLAERPPRRREGEGTESQCSKDTIMR